jgi:FRG domain
MTPDSTGFVTEDVACCDQPWLNIARFRNEISPAARPGSVQPLPAGNLLLDTYYGQAFDYDLPDDLAIYGATPDLPPYPGEENCTDFMRVPYRRIPRFDIKDRAQLNASLTAIRRGRDGQGLLFRGQTSAYSQPRTAATRLALYGDAQAHEPALEASASRKNVRLESILPEWCAILRVFLGWIGATYQQQSDPVLPAFAERLHKLTSDFDLHLLAISLAQHYGLPSMGLDVTDDLDVALFFALHKLEKASVPRHLRPSRKAARSGLSVLYVFAPSERFQLNFRDYCPPGFPSGRPDRQRARFLHTGWGYSRNACARMLMAAFDLDPAGDFGELPRPHHLFPGPDEDPFGGFIELVRSQWDLTDDLRKFLNELYWVESD